MRTNSIILTSLVALGLASGASATTTKPVAAPAKITKLSAKAEAKQDKIEVRAAANKAKLAAQARTRHAKVATKVAVKSHAKPAATHG